MVQISSYGPWAVATGASSGIGRAFAEHLAAAGVNLVLASRSTDRLESLGARLSRAHGIAYRVITVDLSAPAAAAALIEATGDVDVGLLVSNAGGGRPGPFLDQRLDDLQRRLTLNATTHLELAHAFGRRFVERGRSAIVLVSALGVTVLLPGNVDTPIIDSYGFDRADLPVRPMTPEAAVRESVAALLKKRPLHIPGRLMRLVTRLMPRSRSVRMNGRMLGRAAQRLAERELTGAAP